MQDSAWVSAKNHNGKKGLLPAHLVELVPAKHHTAESAVERIKTCPDSVVCYRMTEDYDGDVASDEEDPGQQGPFQVLKGEVFSQVEVMADKRWSKVTTDTGVRGVVPTKALERLTTAKLHFVAVKTHGADPYTNQVGFDVGDVAVDVSRCDDKQWINATNATSGNRGIVRADIFNLPVAS